MKCVHCAGIISHRFAAKEKRNRNRNRKQRRVPRSQKFLVIASPPFQCYIMPVQQKIQKRKREQGNATTGPVRASKKSLCCMLFSHTQGKMPNVKEVKLVSSSNNQVVLVPLSEKVVHVPWHFQPALLAVWAVAHAYTTFVAARIRIVSAAHSDHVGSVETSTSHGRAVACCAQGSAALPLLPYHHRARAVGEGRIGHLADSNF